MRIDMISCLLCDIAISASLVYYFKSSLDALDPLPDLPSKMVTVLQKLIVVAVNQGLLLWYVCICLFVFRPLYILLGHIADSDATV